MTGRIGEVDDDATKVVSQTLDDYYEARRGPGPQFTGLSLARIPARWPGRLVAGPADH